MAKHLLCILVAAGTLVACDSDDEGGDPLCDKAAQVAPRLAAKFAPCVAATGEEAGIATGESCRGELASCSEADRQLVETVLECLDALPACEPAARTAFLDAYRGCVPAPAALSASCRAFGAE
jgi:hypothetical protein